MSKQRIRRSGIAVMSGLIVLLGSLSYAMLFAVINGSLGFLSAMGVTAFGALGIAKALGGSIALSYGWIIGLTVGCGIMRGLLRFFEQYLNHFIAFRLLAVLRNKIFEALRRLCPAKLESKKKGSIIAMITADVETLEVFYAHTVSPVCIALTVCITIVTVLAFCISPYLALIALAGYVAIGIVLPLISSRFMKNDGVDYRRRFSSFNAFYMDSVKGIKDIVLHNAGEKRLDEVADKSRSLSASALRLKKKITFAQVITEAFVSLVTLSAVAAAAALVINGKTDIGKGIIGVVIIAGSFGPVIALSALPGNLSQTFASGDRVLALIDEEPAVHAVENGKDMDFGRVDVSGVSFSYQENYKVLDEVCMHAQKGEIVGIVGESGSGKSTLLKLMLRFWQKQCGNIEYDNEDIDLINTSSLLDNVTMVSQSTYLFDETIRENLTIAKQDATQEQIDDACRRASVYSFIQSLPEGYETKAGTLGDNLSAGERQRIGLARAFLRGSKLILLDEPTSNVDSINEGMILKSLKDNRKDACIILVSHRESTMAIADRVYKIQNGKISEVNINAKTR